MSVSLYMDVHVKRAVIDGLRQKGVDVLTAQEDGTAQMEDSELLDHATALGMVLFSQDDDLLRGDQAAKKRPAFRRSRPRTSVENHRGPDGSRLGFACQVLRTGRHPGPR